MNNTSINQQPANNQLPTKQRINQSTNQPINESSNESPNHLTSHANSQAMSRSRDTTNHLIQGMNESVNPHTILGNLPNKQSPNYSVNKTSPPFFVTPVPMARLRSPHFQGTTRSRGSAAGHPGAVVGWVVTPLPFQLPL